jgi:hypothetical protein
MKTGRRTKSVSISELQDGTFSALGAQLPFGARIYAEANTYLACSQKVHIVPYCISRRYSTVPIHRYFCTSANLAREIFIMSDFCRNEACHMF